MADRVEKAEPFERHPEGTGEEAGEAEPLADHPRHDLPGPGALTEADVDPALTKETLHFTTDDRQVGVSKAGGPATE